MLKVLKIFKSPMIHFVITKYIAFGLQFISAILLAKYLGLYYYGIYGFATLVLQYLSFSNMGIQNSLNVELSTKKNIGNLHASDILNTGLILIFIIGIILFIGSLFIDKIGLFDSYSKYLFSDYYLLLVVLIIFQHFNEIFTNLYRIYGRLGEINFRYLIIPINQILCVLLFKDKSLFFALLISMIISNVIVLLIFILRTPLKLTIYFQVRSKYVVILIKRGINLLAYNMSFYFIVIAARTIVGYYYSVEEFALFNFANGLSNAIMMLLGSISFLIFPKLLNKFTSLEDQAGTVVFLEKIRNMFISITMMIVFASLFIVPLIFYYLPNYKDSFSSYKYLIFAQLIASNSSGYTSLLIQRKKENLLMIYGILSIAVVIVTSLLFVYYFKYSFEKIALSIMVAMFIYNYLIVWTGNKITNQFKTLLPLLKYIYNYRYLSPVVIYFYLDSIICNTFIVSLISFIVYAILNYKEVLSAIKIGLSYITENESLSIFENKL